MYLPITASRPPGDRPARVDVAERVISRWRAQLLGMADHYEDGGLPPIHPRTGRINRAAQYETRWLAAMQATGPEGDGRWYLPLPPLRRLRGWLGARLDRDVDLSALVGMEVTIMGETVTIPAPVDLPAGAFPTAPL